MTDLLTRDAILGADDLKTEEVTVPEWGGKVRIRSLTGAERDRFELSVADGKKRSRENLRARLLALVCVDKEGERIFSQADVEKLGAKNSAPLSRLFDRALRLSAITPADVEELEGNS
jgi:hypothetical protein